MVALCAAFAAGAAGVWLDVPFVRQERNGCGAASLSMILRYWQSKGSVVPDSDTDPGTILRALYVKNAEGIYADDMSQYLRQQGFQTFAFRGEWADLRQHLSKGRPLIAALKPGSLHYVVVTGLDWQQDLVFVNDPAQKKLLKRKRADFEKEWRGTDNWTLLAVPQNAR
jgi:ABC-type bacteriocin/lantibiotic exporter with double-glycine peptidase domain